MTAPFLSRITMVGLIKEVTEGTYLGPTTFIPVNGGPKPVDEVGYEDDTSLANSRAKLRGVYQTTKDTTYGLDFLAYFESIAHFLVAAGFADTIAAKRTVSDGVTTISSPNITSATAAFNSADVGSAITGTGIPAATTILSVQSATAATLSANATANGTGVSFVIGTTGQTRHNFRLSNSQPPSYSLTDYDGYETLGYPGCRLDQLDITIDAKAAIKCQSQWKGWPAASQSQPTPTWPALPPGLGWEVAHTIGGTSVARILQTGITVKSNTEPIHVAQNSQSPLTVFAGESEASLKVKGIRIDDTERNHVLNNDQPAYVTTVTSPSGSPAPVLTITASVTAWKKAPTDRSGKYMTADYDLDAVANTTDGGPFQVLLVNGVASAY